jgi:hypothetical protein
MRFGVKLAALLLLPGCLAAPSDVSMNSGAASVLPVVTMPERAGAAPGALAPRRSNAEMAADFLDLEFQMESGRRLPRLTRFEGPVTIGVSGPAPATARTDLSALIARIRSEAGVDLVLVAADQSPAITPAIAPDIAPDIAIVFSTRAEMRKVVPSAACFVVPGASSLAEYQVRRGSAETDWSRMASRSRALVLIPADTSPQEIRDCLHEEVAQALGPLNDLYRLPDSVFNDDNFQSVLTGFDMLMLRVHYAPELVGSPSEAEVAARLPGVLARLNPAGAAGPGPVARQTPEAWRKAISEALGPIAADRPARLAASRQALALAKAQGWTDSRLGLSWFALGRATVPTDPGAARTAFQRAHAIYAGLPDGGIHAAHVAMQLSALELSTGHLDAAQAWINSAAPALPLAQSPALSAMLMLIGAEIAELQGRPDQAAALRLDSRAAARYGFGPDQSAARAAEIARLGVLGGQGRQG